ncbi:ABC transporter ATP-binding protein [Pseudorhodoplanes sp.]|uniref:ABC transporter ATP-binding protein n=1 Tax=Pseudorhodoplanes sp. TaxID=1934341 RepID=UPI003D12BDC6
MTLKPDFSEPLLQVEQITKRFGGLLAVDSVSMKLFRGQVHALIGPNGAGKSTLVNLISGDTRPTFGRVYLQGADISGLPLHEVSQLGVARSYQHRNVFFHFSAFENCRLAAQSRLGSSMRLFRPAYKYQGVNEAAAHALDQVGLEHFDRIAATLSHGEIRQLEIAMSLATQPEVLLLDEPLAGMGAEESMRMIELISKLAPHHAVLLVEHDMDAVFRLANLLTVMVQGGVIASGDPATVKANRAVQEAYLGTD